jgi:hypothetical protein
MFKSFCIFKNEPAHVKGMKSEDKKAKSIQVQSAASMK